MPLRKSILFVGLAFLLSPVFVGFFSASAQEVFPIKINEIVTNSGSGKDWVEFYNPSPTAFNLGGYCLRNSSNPSTGWSYTIPSNTFVPASGFLVLEESQFGHGGFYYGTFTVAIFASGCNTLLQSVAGPALANGHSFGAQIDGGTTFADFASPTKGTANFPDTTAPPVPSLLSPDDNFITNTPTSLIVDWETVSDISSPVYYLYQESLSNVIGGAYNSFTIPINGSSNLFDSQFNISGKSDGVFYWQIKSCDAKGNCSNWSNPRKITVDTVAPVASLMFDGTGSAYRGFRVVYSEDVLKTEAENPANYFLHNWPGAGGSGDLNGDASVSYDTATFTATVSFTSAGWYLSPEQEWGVENIHDFAGNVISPNPTEKATTVMQNPQIAILSPTEGYFSPTTWGLYISGSSSDPPIGSGIKKIEIKIGSGSYQSASGTTSWNYSFTPVVDGSYTIYAKAYDNAGNTKEESTAFVWDSLIPTDPLVTSSSHTPAIWSLDNTIDVGWSDADGTGSPIVGYSIIWDKSAMTVPDGVVNTTAASTTSQVLLDGSDNYFHLRTQDLAGNWSGGKNIGPFYIDTTPPEVFSLTSPTNNQIISATGAVLKWNTAFDAGSKIACYEVFLDGQKISFGSCISNTQFTLSSNLSVGEHAWYIKAVDNLGFSRDSDTWKFKVDNSVPTVAIAAPSNSSTGVTVYSNNWQGVISGSASDDVGISEVRLFIKRIENSSWWDGSVWQNFEKFVNADSVNNFASWSYSLSNPTANYSFLISASAKDGSQNTSALYQVTLVFDNTRPVVDLAISPAGPDGENSWYVSEPKITLSATDANLTSIEYQLDSASGNWTLYKSQIQATEGIHKIYFRALDKAGNISETKVKETKVDLTAPEDVGDLTAGVEDEEVTLDWEKSSSDDIDHYTIYKSTNRNFIPNPETELAQLAQTKTSYSDSKVDNDTKYYYYVIAFDEAGNNSDAKGVSAMPSKENPEIATIPTVFVDRGSVAGVAIEEEEDKGISKETSNKINNGIDNKDGQVMGQGTNNIKSEINDFSKETNKWRFVDKYWWFSIPLILSIAVIWYLKGRLK
jgi:hypothetical protein